MIDITRYVKNEFKKFLYSGNTPVVDINYRYEITGGAPGRFGVTEGGTQSRPILRKKCHTIPLIQASRAIADAGVFNEGAMVFYFDRDDDEIEFDQWDDVRLTHQGIDYFVDSVKMKKASGLVVTLNESSMSTVIVGEMRL